MPYAVPLRKLDTYNIFEWSMAHLVVKNGQLKNDACYKNIGLHARDVDTNLSPIPTQWRRHLLLFERKEKLNFDLLYMPHLNSNAETQNDNSSQLLAR